MASRLGWARAFRLSGPPPDGLARAWARRAGMAKRPSDENPGVAARFGGSGIPTRLVFEGSHPEDRPVGVPARTVRGARLDGWPMRTPR